MVQSKKTVILTAVFLILLSLLGAIGFLPLMAHPTDAFFTIDPDSTYITNSILYLTEGRIYMTDHPGTPLTALLSSAFLPLKLYVEINGVNFVEFMVTQFDFIHWYARIYVLLIFIIASIVIHLSLYRLFENIFVNALYTYMYFHLPMSMDLPGKITPEVVGYLLYSLWLFVLSIYLKRKKVVFLLILAILGGIATAAKYNFIFLNLVIVLAVFLRENRFRITVKHLIFAIITAIASIIGFWIATIPQGHQRHIFYRWLVQYIVNTERSGVGPGGFVNLETFNRSAEFWFGHNNILLLFFVVMLIYFLIKEKEKFWSGYIVAAGLGFIAFMKYFEQHYQFPTLLAISVFVCLIYSKLNKNAQFVIVVLLFIQLLIILPKRLEGKNLHLIDSSILTDYIDNIPDDRIKILKYGRTREFALLRSREWSYDFFGAEFKKHYPNTLLLDYRDNSRVLNLDWVSVPLYEYCGKSEIIIPEKQIVGFLASQADAASFVSDKISGTEYSSFKQINCQS